MATTQQQNPPLHVVLEWCDDPENGTGRGRSSGRQVGLKAVAESFSVDPMSFASSTCSPLCPLARLLWQGTQPPDPSSSAASRSPRSPCRPEQDLNIKLCHHLAINILEGFLDSKEDSRTGRRHNRAHRIGLRVVHQWVWRLFASKGCFSVHDGTLKPHNWVHRVGLRVIYQRTPFLQTNLGKFLRFWDFAMEMLWLWKNTILCRHQFLACHGVVFDFLLKMIDDYILPTNSCLGKPCKTLVAVSAPP